MPLVSHRTEVAAPAALIWQMLLEKIERPDLYVPGVRRVEVVRRISEGCIERRMYLGEPERAVHEIISADAATRTIVFKLLDDPLHIGFVTNTLFEEAGGVVLLDYTMHWTPRQPPEQPGSWQEMIRSAVLHMKTLAEHRAQGA